MYCDNSWQRWCTCVCHSSSNSIDRVGNHPSGCVLDVGCSYQAVWGFGKWTCPRVVQPVCSQFIDIADLIVEQRWNPSDWFVPLFGTARNFTDFSTDWTHMNHTWTPMNKVYQTFHDVPWQWAWSLPNKHRCTHVSNDAQWSYDQIISWTQKMRPDHDMIQQCMGSVLCSLMIPAASRHSP